MSDFQYEIKDHIATLSKSGNYAKEVNLISYRGGDPVIDIRKWDKESEKMLKGVTLTKAEARALIEALKGVDLNEDS